MGRRIAGAAGTFAILAGAILLVASMTGESEGESAEAPPIVQSRAVDGLVAIQRAQRALRSANYGDLRAHLDEAQDALTQVLQELGEEPPRAEHQGDN